MLDLALLTFLDNIGFTRLQIRVDAHLDFERSLLSPFEFGGGSLALRADLDDLLDRIGHTLGFGLGIHNLRVLDGQGSGDLVLTELAFLNSFLLTGFHRVIEDDLGLERHVLEVLTSVSALGARLGADADDLLGRFLGALRGHDWVARRLTVHDLLSRGHNLGTKLTLLVNDLLAGLEGVIEDDLRLEWNRLLGLGHELARSKARAVLDDSLNGFLGGLFLDYLGLVTLSSELSGVGLLAVFTFLDDPRLSRLQFWVFANLSWVRDWNRPRDFLGALCWLRANKNNLVDWSLGLLPRAVLVLLLRARLAFGLDPVLTGRNGVVVLVLDVEGHLARRNIDDVHHCLSRVGGSVFIGHRDRDLDLRTRLGIFRCGCGDLTVVVDLNSPAGRNITQLVGVVLRNVDVVRFLDCHGQFRGVTWVNRFYRVRRFCFPTVGQLHHGGDRHLRSQAPRPIHCDSNGFLVAWLRIGRRGGSHNTSIRVDLVLPSVDLLFGDRLTILLTKGE